MSNERRSLVNLANKISIARILLIPFFIASIVYYKNQGGFFDYLPMLIFLAAVLSDALDGFIARRFNQKTELGTIIDPLADKLLILTAFVCLAMSKSIPQNLRLPAWLPILVISRDIIIILGTVLIHLVKGRVRIVPTVWGKITTFFQMSTILAVLMKFPQSFVVWNLAGIFTVASGVDYIVRGSRLLNENNA
ncbi:MAG: CDP-diacylglycerol--glycerol-3-phosphate 3-phosphatidyltransferase [Candidatus Omnitrophica bacterium]|nr:CDP-diacylglycerol--glycerol-3-phosphate 3-phosphatidyltransferase [Candidatus Omnitrophota bacterium]